MDLVLAVIIDMIVGDPYFMPHPVKLMGRLISLEEKLGRKLFKSRRGLFAWGDIIVTFNIAAAFIIPFYILKLCKVNNILYHIVNVYFLYTCIAARCLHKEGMKIYKALNISIEEARVKLSYIVGRDTQNLDEKEVVRATVETIAENTADGVIAPLLYAIIGGAPLAFVYKFVNTMDSMLGYMNEKYRDIGFLPAKCDDVFNFIPARITGVLMILSSVFRFNVKKGFTIMMRDRKNHKSPNCAYPEGAAAGLLDVQLGGTNIYFGEAVYKPTIGDPVKELNRDYIGKTCEIMYRAEILTVLFYLIFEVLK